MTDSELDRILTISWPRVLRRAMVDGSDDWLKGFVRSIARHGKRPSWRPSLKQEQIMRQLVADLGTEIEPEFNPIDEGDRHDAA